MKLYTPRTFRPPQKDLTDFEKAALDSWRKERSALAIKNDFSWALFHRTNQDPEGTCETRFFIDQLFVKENERKKGHGTALINEMKRRCASNQGLCVIVNTPDAEAFFVKNNFRRYKKYDMVTMPVLVYEECKE